MAPKEIETEFLFEVKIPQGKHHVIGQGPLGYRRFTYPRAGAWVEGPALKGTVLAGGGDPFLMRSDGVVEIDARITLESEDGDLIMMNYRGVFRYRDRSGKEGKWVDPGPEEDTYFYVSVLFETASERYRWLNGILGVARGFIPEDMPNPSVGYRVFAVR